MDLSTGPSEPLAVSMESPPTDIWMGHVPQIRSSPDGNGVRRDKNGGKEDPSGRDQVIWQDRGLGR